MGLWLFGIPMLVLVAPFYLLQELTGLPIYDAISGAFLGVLAPAVILIEKLIDLWPF